MSKLGTSMYCKSAVHVWHSRVWCTKTVSSFAAYIQTLRFAGNCFLLCIVCGCAHVAPAKLTCDGSCSLHTCMHDMMLAIAPLLLSAMLSPQFRRYWVKCILHKIIKQQSHGKTAWRCIAEHPPNINSWTKHCSAWSVNSCWCSERSDALLMQQFRKCAVHTLTWHQLAMLLIMTIWVRYVKKDHGSATLTVALPMFSPCNIPMKALGALLRPSVRCSMWWTLPTFSHCRHRQWSSNFAQCWTAPGANYFPAKMQDMAWPRDTSGSVNCKHNLAAGQYFEENMPSIQASVAQATIWGSCANPLAATWNGHTIFTTVMQCGHEPWACLEKHWKFTNKCLPSIRRCWKSRTPKFRNNARVALLKTTWCSVRGLASLVPAPVTVISNTAKHIDLVVKQQSCLGLSSAYLGHVLLELWPHTLHVRPD